MLKSRGVSDMTPFEAAGYTKDTVLRVCATDRAFALGTLVQLKEDDGSECPLFDSSTDTSYILISSLEYVSGPRATTMNREELTSLINEILDTREGLPSIPPDFIRWRGGDRPVSKGTEVEVILRNGNRLSRSAGSLDWYLDNHPRDIIAYRVLTDARAVEARELRAWFNEHAPTKFKQGDMVVCDGRVCIVCGIAPYSDMRKYIVFAQGFARYMEEEELTRYEEGE